MSRGALTDFELMILLAILRVGEGAYGVPVAREIEKTGKRTVAVASVYVALDRLEQCGLVISEVGESTPQRGGRGKRFFCVTTKGLRAVRNARLALTAMWRNVPALKGGNA
jgi:DNA-binding PadR family transcriptional regulator